MTPLNNAKNLIFYKFIKTEIFFAPSLHRHMSRGHDVACTNFVILTYSHTHILELVETFVLLTINILTLLKYKSFYCYHKNVNYVNHDELELINFGSSWSKP